jgi:hypothetical protein
MQIWNFNATTFETWGAGSFDLYMSTSATPPASLADMTLVQAGVPLTRMSSYPAEYLGETFVSGTSSANVIPDEVGDANGATTLPNAAPIAGRWLWLGNMSGAPGANRVGLSEIRLYGRAAGSPEIVVIDGSGINDSSMTFRGTLGAVNAALNGLIYRGNPDYNSGNPNAVPPNVVPDLIHIQVNDLGNVDHRTPPGNLNPDYTLPSGIKLPRTAEASIAITVRPKQDRPGLGGITAAEVDEDTPTVLGAITVEDVDSQYDPDWRGQVTLSVTHGTLTLPQAASRVVSFPNTDNTVIRGTNANGTGSPAPEGGQQGDRDEQFVIDGAGLTNVGGKLVHSNSGIATSWNLTQLTGGLMVDLGAVYTLDVLQLWNFNVAGLTAHGPTSFDLWVSSAGTTLPGSTAGMTRVMTGVPLNPAPGSNGYLGETYLLDAAAVIPDDLGDHDGITPGPGDLGLSGPVAARFLFFGNLQGAVGSDGTPRVGLSELRVFGRPFTADDLVFTAGDGVADRTMTFRGSLDDLRTVLAAVSYTPDPDYNSGNPNAVPPNVVPDELVITVSDLGNTDVLPVAALSGQSVVPITVHPVQDDPVVDVTGVTSTQVNEDSELLLQGILLDDPDAFYDPAWRGEVTLTAEVGVLRKPVGAAGSVRIAIDPAAVKATGRDGQDVDASLILPGHTPAKAVDGTVGVDMALVDVNPDPAVTELRLAHGTGANSGWALRQETGGLMIDLGAVYVIDAMQIWNFNRTGLEAYGTASFDLYVSTEETPPVSNSQMNPVVMGQAIPRAAIGDAAYLGETFLFGGAPTTVLPAVWGDESGVRTNVPATVRARYLLLGNLRGQAGSGHVGLSEIQLVGRVEADSQAFTGTLTELRSWVNGTVFRPPVDFNSGDPDNDENSPVAPIPGFTLNPVGITVELDDLGNTDIDPNALRRTHGQTFDVIVRPVQDTPIPVLPAPQWVDEDMPLTFAPDQALQVFDVDARRALDPVGADVYDPDWRGSVELSVQRGTLSLAQATGPAQILGAAGVRGTSANGSLDVAAENAFRSAANVVDGSRLNTGVTPWVHSNQESVPIPGHWSVAQQNGGLMIDLGAVYAIDALQIWNFNLQGNDASGNPLTNYGPTSFNLYVSAVGNSWPAGAAAMQEVALNVALNRAPATAGYLGETYLFGEDIVPPTVWGDHDGSRTLVNDTAVTARYLFLGNLQGTASAGGHVGLSEVQIAGRLVGTPNLVLREGDGVADRRVRFEGPLDELNEVLSRITYLGDLHYNSGLPTDPGVVTDPDAPGFDAAALAVAPGITPDVLSIRVDDLGNTGINPGGVPSWRTASLPIVVLPIQNDPRVDVSGVTSTLVNEDTDLLLRGIVLSDPDAAHDPNWRGSVMVTAKHGVLRMPMGSVGTVPIAVELDRLLATNADGSRVPQPLNLTGHGENKAIDGTVGVDMALVDVNPDPAVIDEKLIHLTGENQGWVVWQERGGLLIDLGDVYAIDAMQIWNFNEAGLEAYGAQSFDLYVSTENTDQLPADRNAMTLVQSNVSLPRVAPGNAAYVGETFLFGGATRALAPPEWGDQDGTVPTLAAGGARARYVLLGNMSGVPGAGHVGLSEIRFIGRREEPGKEYTGTLSELINLVNSTVYRGLPDYNSGNPASGIITPDEVTVTLSDLGNTNRDGGPPPTVRTHAATFEVTVRPIQDFPTVPLAPEAKWVVEDQPLHLNAADPIRVFDVDARSSLEVDANTLTYDPLWRGSLELSVQRGTLSLPYAAPAGHISSGVAARGTNATGTVPLAAENVYRLAENAVNGSRLNTAAVPWVHSNLESVQNPSSWSVVGTTGGLMIDLGAVYSIDALQIWNFNLQGNDAGGNPLTSYGPTRFDLYASVTGNAWPAGAAAMTPVATSVGLNRAPGTANYVGETYLFGDAAMAPPAWGDHDAAPTLVADAQITARYLFLGNLQGSSGGRVGLSEVQVFGQMVGAPDLVFREGDGVNDPRMRFEGSLDTLNAMLDALVYQPNPRFNSGVPLDPAVVMNPAHPDFDAAVLAAAAGVVPDVLQVRVGDLGNTDIAGALPPRFAAEQIPIVVLPVQNDPFIDVTLATGAVVAEDSVTGVTLGPIVIGDVDAQYNGLVLDANWEGQVRLTAANGRLTLPAAARPAFVPVVPNDLRINGTNSDGTQSVPPMFGEGGIRDENHLVNGNGLVLVDVNPDPDVVDQKWIHANGPNDATRWSIARQHGGLMIDLGEVWTIDLMQIWNFNVPGFYHYGPTSFDLYVSSTGTAMPAGIGGMTPLGNFPLRQTSSALDAAGYLGETYLFSGATSEIIPARLGDADGPSDFSDSTVQGRFLFLGMSGTALDGGFVGLSELQFFGRRAGSPQVTYEFGDGVDDQEIIIRGKLADLNAALNGIVYTPNPDYNSGNPLAGDAEPDTIEVWVSDLGHTDYRGNLNVGTAEETVFVTVLPKNDPPTVDISGAAGAVLDEDTSLVLGPIVVGDIDAADDPLWQGQVTLSVSNGTLTLPAALTTDQLTLTGTGKNADGSGNPPAMANRPASAAFDGSGLELDSVSGRLLHRGDESGGPVAWSIAQETGGLLIDLGASYKVDLLQIWNFNVAGLESYGTNNFDLWVGDSPANLTRVLDNEPLARAVPGDVNYLGQTFLFSDATLPIIPPELGDESGGVTNRSGIMLEGQYLFIGDLRGTPGGGHVGLSELRLYGRATGTQDLVFVTGDGKGDATVTFRGTMAALNAALDGITYTPNPDYNSGNPNAVPSNVVPDELVITINDLGNTDVLTPPGNTNPAIGTARIGTGTVEITVRPIQDGPSVDVSQALGAVVEEDETIILGPIVLSDVDALNDPAWRGEVTLTAANGVLTLPEEVRSSPLATGLGTTSGSATIVYVVDISGSTGGLFGGPAIGDWNNDGFPNRIIDGEIAGFIALNNQLVNQFGSNATIAIVPFDHNAIAADMNPALPGVQLATGAHVDADNNGQRDVEEVLRSLRSTGGTSFDAALLETIRVLQALNSDPATTNVIFISDGSGFVSPANVAAVRTLASNVRAFGAGSGASLTSLQVIDPEAQIFLTTDQLLTTFGSEGVVTGSTMVTAEGRTGTNGGIVIDPENGDGGPRDEQFAINRLGLVEVPVNVGGRTVNKVVHTAGLNDSTKWSIPVQSGGFMVDLGAEYTIDVMQIWNFNATGLENYGPTSFDLWVSSTGTGMPADTSSMTQVLNDVPLNRATVAADPSRYFGETYLFGQANAQVIPTELYDEDGPQSLPLDMNGQPLTVTGRFLYFGDLTGTADAGGHVGLSEIQFYARPAGNPTLEYVLGSGTRNSTVTIRGSLADLNVALAAVQYQSNLNYHSGHPSPGNVIPDIIRVDFTDLGNTGTPLDPGGAMTASADIPVVVTPIQDRPVLELSVTEVLDAIEDQEYPLPAMTVSDVDQSGPVATMGPAPGNVLTIADRTLDQNWLGELTLTVTRGTLRLTEELTTRLLPLAADNVAIAAQARQANGTGALGAASQAVNGAGLSPNPSGQLIHSSASADSWLLAQEAGGLLIDLGAEYNVDVLQIWNYAGAGNERFGPQSFDLWVSNTLPSSSAGTAGMTQVLDNEALPRATPGDLNYLGETYLFSAANSQAIAAEIGDSNDGPTDLSAIALRGRYLFLGDLQGEPGQGRVGLSEVRVYGRPATSPNITPVQGNVHGGDRTLVLQGSLPALNNLLDGLDGSVMYVPDPDYNSGNPNAAVPNVVPDRLLVTVSDLGHTDASAATPTALTANRTIPITVRPIQDTPTLTLPSGELSVDENGQTDSFVALLPTGPEVNQGTLIDNDVVAGTPGRFQVQPLAGGNIQTSAVTAQGRTLLLANADWITAFTNYVDLGPTGGAIDLSTTTITMAPTLISDDLVESQGEFTGPNGTVNWRVQTRLDDGVGTVFNTLTLSSTAPLGNIRFISYSDADVQGAADDVLFRAGTPGRPDFRAYTLDDAQRVGLAHGGFYFTGPELANATYDGWAADNAVALRNAITGPGTFYTLGGNINSFALTPVYDWDLQDWLFGPGNVATAFAWRVNPWANSAVMTSVLDVVPRDPSTETGAIVIDDVDASYDPDWRADLTLTALNGTVTLPQNMTAQAITFASYGDTRIDGTEAANPAVSVPPDGGENGSRDENYVLNGAGLTLADVDGNPDTPAQWVHGFGVNDFTKWSVSGDQVGLLIDLGQAYTLDLMQVWNFNADGLEAWGADEFDVYAASGAARPATMADLTLVRANLPLETAGNRDADYLGETYVFGGAGTNQIPAELGDESGAADAVGRASDGPLCVLGAARQAQFGARWSLGSQVLRSAGRSAGTGVSGRGRNRRLDGDGPRELGGPECGVGGALLRPEPRLQFGQSQRGACDSGRNPHYGDRSDRHGDQHARAAGSDSPGAEHHGDGHGLRGGQSEERPAGRRHQRGHGHGIGRGRFVDFGTDQGHGSRHRGRPALAGPGDVDGRQRNADVAFGVDDRPVAACGNGRLGGQERGRQREPVRDGEPAGERGVRRFGADLGSGQRQADPRQRRERRGDRLEHCSGDGRVLDRSGRVVHGGRAADLELQRGGPGELRDEQFRFVGRRQPDGAGAGAERPVAEPRGGGCDELPGPDVPVQRGDGPGDPGRIGRSDGGSCGDWR